MNTFFKVLAWIFGVLIVAFLTISIIGWCKGFGNPIEFIKSWNFDWLTGKKTAETVTEAAARLKF